ncbi:MAG: hypothetical protein ACWA5Q_04375 [bacterium]
MMTPAKPQHSIVAVLGILGLLALAFSAGKALYVETSLATIAKELEDLPGRPSAQLEEILVRLDKLHQLTPSHPDVARKQIQLANITNKPSSPGILPTESAQELYRHLVGLKPTWPLYWSGLVRAKHAAWQFDQEMKSAIRRVVNVGPWFTASLRPVLVAGLDGWPFLDRTTQQAVKTLLEHALTLDPSAVISLALDRGHLAHLQPYIQKSEELQKIYNKVLETRRKQLDQHSNG